MKYPAVLAVLGLVLVTGACSAGEGDNMGGISAEEYVAGLPDDCTYDDGYTCADTANIANTETAFTDGVDSNGMISGTYLWAWNVAWQDFTRLDDLTDEQKKLKHYRVGFSQDRENFIIVLRPLMLPYMEDGKPAGLSRGTIGPGVKYWIDRESRTITKRLYQK
jgi:hypothetical protein